VDIIVGAMYLTFYLTSVLSSPVRKVRQRLSGNVECVEVAAALSLTLGREIHPASYSVTPPRFCVIYVVS
jgi:hypothetical protein